VIGLVLALTLASPAPVRLCAETCDNMGDYRRCYVTPRAICRKRELDCVDSPTLDCVQLVVSLGRWEPVPVDYRPTPTAADWPAVTPPLAPLP
jgi:hypothetical protein